jgi:hypothetical protein
MKPKTIFKVLRLVVSVGLIVFLLARLDVGKIVSHLRGVALLPLLNIAMARRARRFAGVLAAA